MQIDRAKLKSVILYAISACKAEELGAVKLHKVLYFSDMLHFMHEGHPITGAKYRKRPFGPTCDQLLPALGEMSREKEIDIFEENYFGYCKKTYAAHKEPELNRFSKTEISLINEVIDFVCKNNTAKTISTFSHNLAWEMVDFGDELPYKSAYYILPAQVSPEAMEWASEEVERVESQRSKESSVVNVSFADFRSRISQARS